MIWPLVILAITNVGSLAVFAWFIYIESKEKSKTINALIAKSSQDFSNFELADKMDKVKVEPQQNIQADLQELGDLTNEDFDKNILS